MTTTWKLSMKLTEAKTEKCGTAILLDVLFKYMTD